ncbi:MAG: hypothetical protein LKH93_19745 [Clostridium beijerinckii]|jgi:hypothetical protein|nr:hypothetical protein [Clostridium beijerinckii]MCI1578975.1 hypothetical protein [Clostridium beijerinckii]MCI1585059.1 hypothetical protein [Clostridium beijerinckii]MCI1624408.1 hypothetical protein [Clostridium beijerinckii]
MALTQRDREILTWIQDYKSITLSQCTYLFFNANYEGCRRRLKQLESFGLLKSIQNQLLRSRVYYQERLLTDHDLFIYEFLKVIKVNGGEIIQFQIKPQYMENKIIPDCFIIFSYNGNVFFILLEVDLTHYTSNTKMKRYEELYKTGELQKICCKTFPIVVIARPTQGIRYNSYNFNCIYLDLFYNNLNNLLLHNSSII